LDAVGATQRFETVQTEAAGFVLVIDGSQSEAGRETGQRPQRRRTVTGPGFDLPCGNGASRQAEDSALDIAVRPAAVESAVRCQSEGKAILG
jgi:hypothetical protein